MDLPKIGFFLRITLLKLLLAALFLAIAIPTRGWLIGSRKGKHVEMGLFTVSIGGNVTNVKHTYPLEKAEFQVAIVEVLIGGALLLLAITMLLLGLLRKTQKVVFLVVYMISSGLSGLFLAVQAFFFASDLGEEWPLDLGYSWYMTLSSFILIVCSFVSFGTALKRGEAYTGIIVKTKSTTTVTNILYMQKF